MQKTESAIGVEDASPEEEAQYEQAYDIAMRTLHSGKVAKNTVGRVLNAETPAKGVANAAFVIIRKTEVNMEEEMEGSVKIQLAEDVVMEILDVMVESDRMKEPEITDQLVEDIVKELYTKYTEDAEGRGELDPETVKQDVMEGEELMGQEKPQGNAAMSNKEVEDRGLMNV